jgi:hypothetical protein
VSGHEQLSTVSRKIGKDQVSGPEDRERRGFDGLRDGVAAGYSKQAGATAPEHPAADSRFLAEVRLVMDAPSLEAANRMADDAIKAIERTDVYVRDGRIVRAFKVTPVWEPTDAAD